MIKAQKKSIEMLSHPLVLAALVLLLLNDHVLRRLWPSWWTGKLGDFTWLLFFPFVAAFLLAGVIPANSETQVAVVVVLGGQKFNHWLKSDGQVVEQEEDGKPAGN